MVNPNLLPQPLSNQWRSEQDLPLFSYCVAIHCHCVGNSKHHHLLILIQVELFTVIICSVRYSVRLPAGSGPPNGPPNVG